MLDLIRRMKAQGVSVMLISHRMPDVFAVCDRIIVMRRGTKVADKRDGVDITGRDHRTDHGSDTCSLTSLHQLRIRASRRQPRRP